MRVHGEAKSKVRGGSRSSTSAAFKNRDGLPPNIAKPRTSRSGAAVFAAAMFAAGFALTVVVSYAVTGTVGLAALIGAVFVGWFAASSIHIVLQWERAVILRLGKYNRTSGPGVVFTVPLIEFYTLRVDQRVAATYFGAEETLTRDLVPINVDAVLFWMVFSPEKAATEVEDYASAVSWVAQTAMRKAIGRNSVAEVATRRDQIDDELKDEIEKKLSPWGIDIIGVEIRDIVVPKELQEAMSREAIAEREKEARMVLAEAEKDISDMLADASETYRDNDVAMRLRTMHLAYESVKSSGGRVVLPSSFSEGFVDPPRGERPPAPPTPPA